MLHPKISIVTVCRNSEETIKETIKSVLKAISINTSIEYIIQDGMSEDNTFEIAKTLTLAFPQVSIYREQDNSLYDAMNKGIAKAKGEYILFLNSDDILLSTFWKEFLPDILDKNDNIDYFLAPVVLFKRPSFDIRRVFISSNKNLNFFSRIICSECPSHPGFICRSSLLRKYKFDLRYLIASDYNQILRIIRNKRLIRKYYSAPLVAMAMGGRSNTFKGFQIAMKEMMEINKKLSIEESLLLRYFRNSLQYIIFPIIMRRRLKLRSISQELARNYT